MHFFWGSFDLAVTRFSGRTAPPPTGATPNRRQWADARRPIRTRSRAAASGRERRLRPRRVLRLRPIRSLRATAARRCARRGPSTTRAWPVHPAEPTWAAARPAIPMHCCSASCRKPTPPPPISRNGTARRSNAARLEDGHRLRPLRRLGGVGNQGCELQTLVAIPFRFGNSLLTGTEAERSARGAFET